MISLSKRLVFSAIVTLVLLLLLEAALWLFTSITPFQPFRLRSDDPKSGSRTYTYFFNSKARAIVMPKPKGIYRIFCFGASAVKGTPFAGGGFPEFMQAIFQSQRPAAVEVINLGADGFTSGMLVEVFRDALGLDPDLCIISIGDNELLGFSRVNRKAWPRLNRGMWWLMRQVRLVQLPMVVIDRLAIRNSVISMMTQLPRVERRFDWWLYPPEKKRFVRELFLENLEAMVKLARSAGVEVVLCAPGSNLRDWIPLKSVHAANLTAADKRAVERAVEQAREDLQARRFLEARALLLAEQARDPHYAKLLTFLGQAELGLGNLAVAGQDLEQAVSDADFFQQSPPEQNRALLDFGRRRQVPVLDVDAYLRSLEPKSLPGFDRFVDGCHPTLETHYLIARRLADFINDSKLIASVPSGSRVPSFEELRPEVNLSSAEAAGAYLNLALILGFLYPHPEYFEPAIAFLDQARALGSSPVIVYSYQGYLRVLQGRILEAADFFSRARNADPPGFSAAVGHLLSGFARYDGTLLELKPAGPDGKVQIYRATLRVRPPPPPRPEECRYHLLWDPAQSRFIVVREGR